MNRGETSRHPENSIPDNLEHLVDTGLGMKTDVGTDLRYLYRFVRKHGEAIGLNKPNIEGKFRAECSAGHEGTHGDFVKFKDKFLKNYEVVGKLSIDIVEKIDQGSVDGADTYPSPELRLQLMVDYKGATHLLTSYLSPERKDKAFWEASNTELGIWFVDGEGEEASLGALYGELEEELGAED